MHQYYKYKFGLPMSLNGVNHDMSHNVRNCTLGNVRPTNIQINMCILAVCSESSQGALSLWWQRRFRSDCADTQGGSYLS